MDLNTNISKPKFNWKLFFILWAGIFIGLIALIPYTLTLQSAQLEKIQLPMPLEVILIIQLSVNVIVLGLLTGLGLFLANKYGLGLPIIEKILNKEKVGYNVRKIVLSSIILGVTIALIIQGLSVWVFNLDAHLAQLGIDLPASIIPEAWKGFLAAFYGGITEEVLMRLFLLTFIVWLGMIITKNKTGKPSLTIFWIANILAAVLFGVGHLPATAGIGAPLDFFVISRAIVLNGIGGLVFGWLYFTYGLESAMIAHFSADIVIHVIL